MQFSLTKTMLIQREYKHIDRKMLPVRLKNKTHTGTAFVLNSEIWKNFVYRKRNLVQPLY